MHTEIEPKHCMGQDLTIQEFSLPPGAQWAPKTASWMLVHVVRGEGYWMHPTRNQELSKGSTLILSRAINGSIRASQLGQVDLNYYHVEPERLAGLITLEEKQCLQGSAVREGVNFKVISGTDPISERASSLFQTGVVNNLRLRLQLLELFFRTFDEGFGGRTPALPADEGARARLDAYLKRMPASAMLDLSFSRLAQEIRCTPRHLSRVFLESVGMSFRDKQAEARLMRARELLETTRSKIHQVAEESRYPSLSLFNAMFRKRFGVTPARWREQVSARNLTGAKRRNAPSGLTRQLLRKAA